MLTLKSELLLLLQCAQTCLCPREAELLALESYLLLAFESADAGLPTGHCLLLGLELCRDRLGLGCECEFL